ncbi:MAG: IclR family transcriptional regulator [Desulfobacteraceae bacterium]|jgi:IclR family KDG regulon transcriptional repressor
MTNSGRVPALYRCFAILELLSQADDFPGNNEIARRLGLNKSTVSNTMHTLADLGVLEIRSDGKFIFGPRFYLLANMAGKRSELQQTAHPYLGKINRATKLSTFLGIRSGNCSMLIDKADSQVDIKVSSEIGMKMPPLAGAGIKAMLSQLSDREIDRVLSESELKRFTPNSITKKSNYKREVASVRSEGIALDMEEYIEGLVAVGIPVRTYSETIQAAIWAVGLKRQLTEEKLGPIKQYLSRIEKEINQRFQ